VPALSEPVPRASSATYIRNVQTFLVAKLFCRGPSTRRDREKHDDRVFREAVFFELGEDDADLAISSVTSSR